MKNKSLKLTGGASPHTFGRKNMKTINTAKTQNIKTYLWDSGKEVFGPYSSSSQFSFFPDIKIIVDAHLTAQQLDVIFNEIFSH